MTRLHLHLVSDSTGETLESMAKAALAQFDRVEALKHFWPMVRSDGHLDRVLAEIGKRPGLVLFTLVEGSVRERLETRCSAMGLPTVAALDPVIHGLQMVLGQAASGRPGRQHLMDEAYFARVEAIQYTMAHDDGQNADAWEEADIVIAGVSRSSKTPTAVYLANRGYKVANMPLVGQHAATARLSELRNPLVVGLTIAPDRLVAIRRNRLIAMGSPADTAYVDQALVAAEVMAARRLFADKGWPTIDVTRRSIEETAAAIINLMSAREEARPGFAP